MLSMEASGERGAIELTMDNLDREWDSNSEPSESNPPPVFQWSERLPMLSMEASGERGAIELTMDNSGKERERDGVWGILAQQTRPTAPPPPKVKMVFIFFNCVRPIAYQCDPCKMCQINACE